MRAIWQFLSTNAYRKEITLVIILKLLLLTLLWHFFFAHPVQLTNENLVKQMSFARQAENKPSG